MRKQLSIIALVALTLTLGACQKKSGQTTAHVPPLEGEQKAGNDTTVYGVCGEGTSMNEVMLVTDTGDTLDYHLYADEGSTQVGGLMAGDRVAIVGYENAYKELVAQKVINLTSLLGRWTSIDKSFEIQEGGVVKSDIKTETDPWTTWKIVNARLVLNRDTFDIDALGADSLYLENKQGIYVYKRQK